MTSQIPTLDIRRFTHPTSPEDRQAFIDELGAAYREWGFAGIRGHGIPQSLVDRAYDAFQRFFALPADTKQRYHVPGGGGARGYTPFMVETAKDSQHPDLKEFWHVGRELPTGHCYVDTMAPNVWPDRPEAFRDTFVELFAAFDRAGDRVLVFESRVSPKPAPAWPR